MVRTILTATLLAVAPAPAPAQSTSTPLVVTATVVSSCRVDVPGAAERSALPSVPVSVTCARRGAAARVQRPRPSRRREIRDAVLTIDF